MLYTLRWTEIFTGLDSPTIKYKVEKGEEVLPDATTA
jgi:hypothetical protein